jgi:hypothetical protein
MEKQTKILLGVGAVIAAYLILKPKKVLAAAPISQSERKVNTPWNTEGYDPCANGFTYECAVSRGGGGVVGPRPINITAPIPKGPCVCITAPCNC